MVDLVKLGHKISAYRKENNLTQDNLANQLFVTRQALSKWEIGLSAPSLENLVALCKIFQIDIEELLSLNSSHFSVNQKDLFSEF